MTASSMVMPAILVATAYLVGSIPFSWIVVRLFKKVDIRQVGSGNVGATNVLRNAGKGAGFAALLLDGLKGWAVVFGARIVTSLPAWPWDIDGAAFVHAASFWIGLAALAAIIGHMYPVWLRFEGGKGVATGAGAYLAIDPIALVFTVMVFFAALAITRYVSIGSMSAAAVFPLFLRFLTGGTTWEIVFSVLIGLLVIVKHHTNVARIISGEERKFP